MYKAIDFESRKIHTQKWNQFIERHKKEGDLNQVIDRLLEWGIYYSLSLQMCDFNWDCVQAPELPKSKQRLYKAKASDYLLGELNERFTFQQLQAHLDSTHEFVDTNWLSDIILACSDTSFIDVSALCEYIPNKFLKNIHFLKKDPNAARFYQPKFFEVLICFFISRKLIKTKFNWEIEDEITLEVVQYLYNSKISPIQIGENITQFSNFLKKILVNEKHYGPRRLDMIITCRSLIPDLDILQPPQYEIVNSNGFTEISELINSYEQNLTLFPGEQFSNWLYREVISETQYFQSYYQFLRQDANLPTGEQVGKSYKSNS
ncbi:MAG: hypothetical protein OHK0017_04820 [Patescibacteria group bacterium]